MNLLDKVNVFTLTYLEVFRSFKRFGLWLPFFVHALLQIIILFILLSFSFPLLAWVFVPILKGVYGEAILHYPNFFLYLNASPTWWLPGAFNLTSVIMGLLFGIVLDGAAAFMFCSYFAGKGVSFFGGLRAAFSKYWTLLVLGVLGLPVILVMKVPFLLLKDMVAGSPRRGFALDVGCMILGVMYAGIFAYAVPVVIWRGKKTMAAIRDSWRIFIGNLFSTFLFIFIPLIINFPINILKGQSPALISKFNPEIIIWIMVFGVVLSVFADFLRLGTIIRFYLEHEDVE